MGFMETSILQQLRHIICSQNHPLDCSMPFVETNTASVPRTVPSDHWRRAPVVLRAISTTILSAGGSDGAITRTQQLKNIHRTWDHTPTCSMRLLEASIRQQLRRICYSRNHPRDSSMGFVETSTFTQQLRHVHRPQYHLLDNPKCLVKARLLQKVSCTQYTRSHMQDYSNWVGVA